jgi:hypothetical protein
MDNGRENSSLMLFMDIGTREAFGREKVSPWLKAEVQVIVSI